MILFCRWAVWHMFTRARIVTAISLLSWITARILRLTSHSRMKQAILKRCEGKFTEKEIDDFLSNNLDGIVNHDVLRIARGSGHIRVLATAAPALYSRRFGLKLGFDYVLATEYGKTEFIENIGVSKLKSVNRLLSEIGAEMAIVITDHYNDAPLLRANKGQNYLVKGDTIINIL